MKPLYVMSLLCGCASLLPVTLRAQEESLSRKDSIKGFNALDYTLQKRVVPAGRPVSNSNKGKNFSISLMGGLTEVERSDAPMLYTGGFAVSKQVSPFNTYRLSVSGAFRKDNSINKTYYRGGAELSHLFNVSDYLNGYHEGARVNLYTVAGVGGYTVKRSGEEQKYAVGLHAGLQFNYHLSQNWDWFIEPKVYLYTDNIDYLANERKYDVGWKFLTGLTYRFTPLPVVAHSEDFPDNLFLEGALGLQGDYTKLIRDKAGNTPGPSASASIGKWWMPLGVRATVFAGYHNTINYANEKHKEAYAGGRVEALVNLNTLFKPTVMDPRLEVNLAGGIEGGVIGHKGATYNGKKKVWFKGLTAAGQLVYFVDQNFAFTGELRYSPSKKLDVTAEPEQMRNLSLMFGLQYRRRESLFRERGDKYHFEPYNFAYVGGGAHWAVHSKLEMSKTVKNLDAVVGLGRWFDPFSGVRGGVEVGHHTGGYYPLNIYADYMLNLTNMIANYMPERILDVNAFAGVVYTHNTYDKGNYFGIEGGLQQVFHLNDRWGIFLEESARLYKNRVMPDARLFTTGRYTFMLNGRMGLTYRF